MSFEEKEIEFTLRELKDALAFAEKHGDGDFKTIKILSHCPNVAPTPMLCAISGKEKEDITDTSCW